MPRLTRTCTPRVTTCMCWAYTRTCTLCMHVRLMCVCVCVCAMCSWQDLWAVHNAGDLGATWDPRTNDLIKASRYKPGRLDRCVYSGLVGRNHQLCRGSARISVYVHFQGRTGLVIQGGGHAYVCARGCVAPQEQATMYNMYVHCCDVLSVRNGCIVDCSPIRAQCAWGL